MLRRNLVLGLILLPAAAALATEDYAQSVVRQLKAQGYGLIEVTSTFLGRTRITAQRGNAWREIILNPHTGEILRDLRQEAGEVRIDDDDDDEDRRDTEDHHKSNDHEGSKEDDPSKGKDRDDKDGGDDKSGKGGEGGEDD